MTQQRPTLRTPALHATAPTSSTAMDPHAALEALWGALRLAVVDVETCQAADGDHIVSIAVATCRNGRPTSTFAALVNPGVPIDARTQRIHGITDEHVEDEPAFADWQPRLTALLTPRDGEQVVLVAHNAPFDVSRLHREYHRLGLALPDVPVLDTRHLPAQVGLRPADGSLGALTAALGITNTRPHDAAADATATAQAAFALLERAAHAGETDFDALLHRTMRGRAARTGDIGLCSHRTRGTSP